MQSNMIFSSNAIISNGIYSQTKANLLIIQISHKSRMKSFLILLLFWISRSTLATIIFRKGAV